MVLLYIKQKFRSLLNKIPYVKQLHQEIFDLNHLFFYPPGDFYSPIVSAKAIKNREPEIWNKEKKNVEEISLNTDKQLALIKSLSFYYNEIPFKDKQQHGLRYYFDNTWYSYTDAIILYSMIRHFKPKQIIEIGSGFSSSVMLDTNELFFDNKIKLIFIEPNPERLYSLLKEIDKQNSTIVEKEVQTIPLDIFAKLEEGDFLFIDTSHVVKTGADVNFIFFKILPILKPGVIIHFHDIFFPFEYPKKWVFEGRNWNEDYFLRAFLMYNNRFGIILFADYLHQFYNESFSEMPLCYKDTGANFWIIKN